MNNTINYDQGLSGIYRGRLVINPNDETDIRVYIPGIWNVNKYDSIEELEANLQSIINTLPKIQWCAYNIESTIIENQDNNMNGPVFIMFENGNISRPVVISYAVLNISDVIDDQFNNSYFNSNNLYNPTTNSLTNSEFIDFLSQYAVEDMHNGGILASITIAQAILESAWGTSDLATNHNALFGIKSYNYNGRSLGAYGIGMDSRRHLYFNSWEDSIKEHSIFLKSNSRYEKVFNAKNYEEAAYAIKNAGYAVDSDYASKLISIIKSNNLDKYDKM